MSLYSELKRRNVFRIAAAYIVVGWLSLQVADIVLDFVVAPEWVGKAIIALLVLGFVPTMAVAWIFEVTPEGIRRDDGTLPIENGVQAKRLDVVTIGAVVILAVMMFWDRLTPNHNDEVAPSTTASSEQRERAPAEHQRTDFVEPGNAFIQANSIAVLPFANRSAESDTQYFVDGVHDDLLTQLARIGDLKVISRTSVLEYRDTKKNMRQIGQELGVATLLEGAVQRAGTRLRINAQLIDAETDKHLWADTFDRELTPDNIFEIQTDIARAIANALSSTLGAEMFASDNKGAQTRNQEAYDLYLQARAIPEDGSVDDVFRSIALSKKAVELDPEFALAMGEVGFGYTNAYWYTTQDPKHRAEGRRWIERALEIAPEDPRLQLIWADHLYHGYLDYDGALEALKKAERDLPNGAEIYRLRSWILRRSGHFQAAIEAMDKAVQLDPRDISSIAHHIFTYVFMGDLEGARRWAKRVRAFPNASDSHLGFAHMVDFLMLGDSAPLRQFMEELSDVNQASLVTFWIEIPFLERRYEDALKVLASTPNDPVLAQFAVWPHSFVRARVLHAQGNFEAAQAQAKLAVDELTAIAKTMPENARPVVSRAIMHAILGNAEAARADAKLATELYPVERDVPEAPNYIADGLRALAMIDDSETLARYLQAYLELEAKTYYVDYLLLDPAFDRHRTHPAIKALEKQYSLRGNSASL